MSLAEPLTEEERPDWVRCVLRDSRRSYCGKNLTGVWAFAGPEHADTNEAQGGRLVTCPACKAMMGGAMEKTALMKMTKEQLIELLELAVQATTQANQNMLTMTSMMAKVNEDAKQLRDEKATLEAELIMLRNRP
jgi:hypothetical protein